MAGISAARFCGLLLSWNILAVLVPLPGAGQIARNFGTGNSIAMSDHAPSDGWIGASLLRKEDARHLLGHGMFIADLRMPGIQDVAFVRSPMAHAVVRAVNKPTDGANRV